MNVIRKKKLIKISVMLIAVGVSVSLILYALRQNISLYYTPSQLTHKKIPYHQIIRIGGIVVIHSVHEQLHSTAVQFSVSDLHHSITVQYHGILPDLFRVGQMVVVQGWMKKNGLFVADQVLAKHGGNYHAK